MVGLCLGFALRFLLSTRLPGGGAPMAARAIDFTAVVARNFFSFFFPRAIVHD